MTLYLTIKQIVDLKLQGQIKIEQKLSLVIQNSTSGAVLIEKAKFNRLRWEQKFKFTTCLEDNVEFILKKGDQKQAWNKENTIGKGKLYTGKFLKMFQKEIVQKQSRNQPFECNKILTTDQITLFKQSISNEKQIGTIQIEVTLDKQKKFQGQMISSSEIDLRGQKHTNQKYVKFYLGKSSKVNLFSLIDEKAEMPKCRFLESIYKDLQ